MRCAPEEKVDVYAHAVRGANLDEHERQRYQQQYAEEIETMSAFADQFIGQGLQQGEATILLTLLNEKFGPDTVDAYRERITAAEPEQLLQWSKRILSAETPETIFH
ncbi:hypothetical protein [Lamprobacter sp.]|uniref:hypothetical protein n=1 Tax=Lamprobacter sp. TaxID=3100796 RepID=UPI003A4DF1A6